MASCALYKRLTMSVSVGGMRLAFAVLRLSSRRTVTMRTAALFQKVLLQRQFGGFPLKIQRKYSA